MPVCLIHNQFYTMNEYCIYCGYPSIQTISTSNKLEYKDHLCDPITDTVGTHCKVCGKIMTPVTYIRPKEM